MSQDTSSSAFTEGGSLCEEPPLACSSSARESQPVCSEALLVSVNPLPTVSQSSSPCPLSDTEPTDTISVSDSQLNEAFLLKRLDDIGGPLTPDKPINEICRAVGDLSGAEEYALLYHNVQLPKVLPSTYAHGCNLNFNTTLLEKYPWLKYSPKQDGVFCGPCALLFSKSNGSQRLAC